MELSGILRFKLSKISAHQSVQVLPNSFADLIYKQTQLTEFMATPNFETRLIGYSDIEVQKLKRIYDWMLSRDEKDMDEHRRNFTDFLVNTIEEEVQTL